MLPSDWLPIWAAGFSQSFANNSIFSIYARNFGAPEPAAIPFGLSGVWPSAIFIKLGLRPVDAYTSMVAMWLSVSFIFSFKLGRYFSLSHGMATLGAVVWGTMPIIWAHAPFSMLSLGIALLPFYIFCAIRFFDLRNEYGWGLLGRASAYLMAGVISALMDGYTFMMFAVASSFLGAVQFFRSGNNRKFFALALVSIYCLVFYISYLLYREYVGWQGFKAESVSFFRGGRSIIYFHSD